MKSQRTLVFALLLGVVALTGCKGEEEESAATTEAPAESPAPEVDRSLPGDPEAGALVYNRICVACHGADGRGNGGVTGADFVGDPSRLAKGNDVLIHSITVGILDKNPPMPAQGQALSEQEIRDALSYVRQTFGGTH